MRNPPLRNRQWDNEPALVLGGGPSLSGAPFYALDSHHKIGCNLAYLLTWVDIRFVGDDRLYKKLLEDESLHWNATVWRGYPGAIIRRSATNPIRLLSAHMQLAIDRGELELSPDTWCAPQAQEGVWPETLSDGLTPGCSGVTAYSLAAVLGASPIYLVGFDMGGGNWHDHYPKDWMPDKEPFTAYKRQFANAPQHVRDRTVVVEPSGLPEDLFQNRISMDMLKELGS